MISTVEIGPENLPLCLPTHQEIKTIIDRSPDYMHPNFIPHIFMCEGLLTDIICDALLGYSMRTPPHRFPGCGGTTRELPRLLPNIFRPLFDWTLSANAAYWGFDIDPSPGAWLQTYETGDEYMLHMDSMPGITRKLTTIVLLSDPQQYEGGLLRFIPYPMVYDIPKTRGTVVTFPSWLLHEVLPVTSGLRQSLNVGFWGPPFK